MHLAWLFEDMAYSLKTSNQRFASSMELLNFAVLDLLTGWFYQLPQDGNKRERFIDNLNKVSEGLKKHGVGETHEKTEV